MGLKMGHHFTAPLMSGPHQFFVYTLNISVVKTPLIHMVYCIHMLQVYQYILSLYADTMKVHQHNTAYLVQTLFPFLCAVYNYIAFIFREQVIHSRESHLIALAG